MVWSEDPTDGAEPSPAESCNQTPPGARFAAGMFL
jgi:hypothetical protein